MPLRPPRHAATLRVASLWIGFLFGGDLSAEIRSSNRIVLPADPCVFNVRVDGDAVGDGVADDTDAIQNALDRTCGEDAPRSGIVYLPNGIYRVTKSLVANRGRKGSGAGPYLFGESRDGVIIRMDDHIDDEAVTSVLRTHPTDSGKTSANWFMRQVRNLTIDVGDNPQMDGVRFMANNVGALRDLKIVGKGHIGVHCDFVGESGPNLVQDCVIDGFDIGIQGRWIYGQTFSRIHIANCREVGIETSANAVAIEDLTITHTPQAVRNVYPKDWHWWSAAMSILGGRLETNSSDRPAIFNSGLLYARDVQTTGYAVAMASNTTDNDVRKDGNQAGENFKTIPDAFTSHRPFVLSSDGDDDAATNWDALPIRTEPATVWEPDPDKWICADDFGAESGDGKDDTDAIQKAIDTAAERGATTVTLRGIRRRTPRSWYQLDSDRPIRIHGSVRHIMGLGFARVLRGHFVVDDDSAATVTFMNLHSFGGPPPTYTNRSTHSTLVIDGTSGTVVGDGTGDIFITNFAGHLQLKNPNQSCWCRHLNVEGEVDGGLVQNHGAKLWVLGTKSEGRGMRYATTEGGRTELHGIYCYTNTPVDPDDPTPIFLCKNASMLVTGFRETCFNGKPYVHKAVVRDEGREMVLDRKATKRRFHTLVLDGR